MTHANDGGGVTQEEQCAVYDGKPRRYRKPKFRTSEWFCEKQVSRSRANAFVEGQEIEVTSEEEGFEGAWFTANIVKPLTRKKTKFLVQYQTLVDDTDQSTPLREFVHVNHIRPLQPKTPPQLFRVNDVVDAFYIDSWWEGTITKVLQGSRYSVCFPGSKKEMVFPQAQIRLHLDWIGGKWVTTSQNKEAALIEQNEGSSRGLNTICSSACRIDMTLQPSPFPVVNTFLESGRMDHESTNDETNLFSVPVSSKMNVKRLPLMIDDEFSRAHKKSRKEKEIASLSIKACSSSGTSIGMPTDEGTHSLHSFPMLNSITRRPLNEVLSELCSGPSRLRLKYDNVSHVPERREKDDLESISSRSKVPHESGSRLHSTESQKFMSGLPMSQETDILRVEGADKQTEVVVKRKRGRPRGSGKATYAKGAGKRKKVVVKRKGGRPRGSGKQLWTGISEPRGLDMPLSQEGQADTDIMKENGGEELEASTTQLTIAQLDYAQLLHATLEDDQTLSQCPEKPFHTIIGGSTGDEAVNNTSEITEIVCTELFGSSTVKFRTPSLGVRSPLPPMNGGNQLMPNEVITNRETVKRPKHLQASYDDETSLNSETMANDRALWSFTDVTKNTCLSPWQPDEGHPVNGTEDETADNASKILEIVCTEMLGPSAEGVHTPSVGVGNPLPPMTGDNQHMPNEEITHTETVKSPKHCQASYEHENSSNLEATTNERALLSVMNVSENTCLSPWQPNEGLAKRSLPFTKCSNIWETIEAKEAFQLIPQDPHFLPLKQENEELREGRAIGHMLNFASLVERIHKASLDNPQRMFQNKLEALDELEVFGFSVQQLRSRLEKMMKIKDNFSQLHERSKTTKVEVIQEKRNAEAIHESFTRLNIELQALLTQKETNEVRVAELQKMENAIEERIYRARLGFDAVVAASW